MHLQIHSKPERHRNGRILLQHVQAASMTSTGDLLVLAYSFMGSCEDLDICSARHTAATSFDGAYLCGKDSSGTSSISF